MNSNYNSKTLFIQYLSDLHLEFQAYEFIPNPKADILILAGDIYNQKESSLKNFDKFMESIVKWDKPCIMIAGNHEYYYGEYNQTKNFLNQLNFKNFYFLDNKSIKINNIKFIGSTLWSDIDLKKYFSICNTINDYRLINNKNKNLTIVDTILEYKQSLDFIENELKEDCKKVVITHHLPSYKSIHEKYKNNFYNSAFASNLDDLILKYSPEIWIHGHSHASCNYFIGKTNIVSNPRGYFVNKKNENDDYIDDKIIEITI